MDYLPAPVQAWLEGRIDPHGQKLIERYSQYALGVLVAISFLVSFSAKSVLLGLEVFLAGFVVMLIATVPPWPYLNQHPIRFLPVRKKSTAVAPPAKG